jgi:hypothetical protein
MTAPLPENAAAIVQARMQGLSPADMVIVSMRGRLSTSNPLVLARPGGTHDWRWARGLDVCVYLPDEDNWVTTVMAIALTRPKHLSVWNPTAMWGAKVYLLPSALDVIKPVSMWKYELDFLPWMDFQNRDFVAGRSYARDGKGVPYAVDC